MRDPFAALPPLGPRVELTIALPARNEEQTIGAAIAALARQRDRDGSPLSFERYDTILFANECADATALHARALARSYPGFQLYVVIGTLPSHAAHVGTARKYVMDAAARRFVVAGRPNGTIATTDADTVVDAAWVAETLAEARSADAVMGRIMPLQATVRASRNRPARCTCARWRIGGSSANSKRCATPYHAIRSRGTGNTTGPASPSRLARTNVRAACPRARGSKIWHSSRRCNASMRAFVMHARAGQHVGAHTRPGRRRVRNLSTRSQSEWRTARGTPRRSGLADDRAHRRARRTTARVVGFARAG